MSKSIVFFFSRIIFHVFATVFFFFENSGSVWRTPTSGWDYTRVQDVVGFRIWHDSFTIFCSGGSCRDCRHHYVVYTVPTKCGVARCYLRIHGHHVSSSSRLQCFDRSRPPSPISPHEYPARYTGSHWQGVHSKYDTLRGDGKEKRKTKQSTTNQKLQSISIPRTSSAHLGR